MKNILDKIAELPSDEQLFVQSPIAYARAGITTDDLHALASHLKRMEDRWVSIAENGLPSEQGYYWVTLSFGAVGKEFFSTDNTDGSYFTYDKRCAESYETLSDESKKFYGPPAHVIAWLPQQPKPEPYQPKENK